MAAKGGMAANDKRKGTKKLQKSYFDVLGLCCSSEVPLIEKILKQLEGIKEVSVIVPSRTVIVIHDDLLISQIQIVKALNQARLEANVRVYGEAKFEKKWPNQYAVACGLFLLLSLFKFLYHPMQWFALAAAIVGLPHILYRSIAAIRNYTLDINILMLIAVGGTLALRDFLEAGSIVFLFTIAEWLESRASHKATAVMSSLMNMAPQKAVLAENGLVVDAQDVKVNTILAVKAGEVIPIDGVVVEGNCEVDEKALTGESYPVSKQINSTVWAGTINLNGYISVRTTALAEDCIVARMAKLVEEAQNKKSRTQKFIDRCAKYYTPVVVLITIGVASIPAILRVHNLRYWLHLALVVLVSACPCALILSTPVATFCALTKAATDGILIKGGDYLEILAKVKIMAFDKTGTITRGEFMVMDLRSLCPDVSLSTLLYWVSSIESKSSHPMAAALVDYGWSKSIEPNPENVKEFKNFPGEGIYGEIDGKGIYVGNRKIATRAGCQAGRDPEGEDKEGHTIGYIYSEANLVGIFSLSDTCRSGVAEAINELKSLGIRTAMLTGDSHSAAMHAQDQLGNALETVHAEILPEQKAKLINYFKKNGTTAMIGDGINDAPALATADIGVSMGISGSALATETGHVILMSNDLRKIPKAIHLARKTNRKVVENVALSFITKTAILALAIAGHPLLWAAVLADVGTCLLVILNSMLLLQGTSKPGKKSCKRTCATYAHKHDSKSGCGHFPHGEHDTVADRPDDIHDPCCHSPPICQRCCSHHEEDQGTTKTKDSDQIKSDSHDIDIHNGKNGVHGCNDTSTDNKHSTFRICDSPKSSATPSCGLNQPVCCSGPSQNMNTITCGGKHIDDHLESGLQVLGERCVDYSHGESGKIKERSCHGCLHDCKDDTERNMLATGHGESTAPFMCVGLEKREIGGCSKSFRKECECSNRCFGVGLVGGLSEIITE